MLLLTSQVVCVCVARSRRRWLSGRSASCWSATPATRSKTRPSTSRRCWACRDVIDARLSAGADSSVVSRHADTAAVTRRVLLCDNWLTIAARVWRTVCACIYCYDGTMSKCTGQSELGSCVAKPWSKWHIYCDCYIWQRLVERLLRGELMLSFSRQSTISRSTTESKMKTSNKRLSNVMIVSRRLPRLNSHRSTSGRSQEHVTGPIDWHV